MRITGRCSLGQRKRLIDHCTVHLLVFPVFRQNPRRQNACRIFPSVNYPNTHLQKLSQISSVFSEICGKLLWDHLCKISDEHKTSQFHDEVRKRFLALLTHVWSSEICLCTDAFVSGPWTWTQTSSATWLVVGSRSTLEQWCPKWFVIQNKKAVFHCDFVPSQWSSMFLSWRDVDQLVYLQYLEGFRMRNTDARNQLRESCQELVGGQVLAEVCHQLPKEIGNKDTFRAKSINFS